VTLSVGTVTMAAHEATSAALASADAAMYLAKRHGGNQVASSDSAPQGTSTESDITQAGGGELTDDGGTWVLPDTP
ncbi:MAG: GGDEF domain-containing protein, partial [Sciscionella sp.]